MARPQIAQIPANTLVPNRFSPFLHNNRAMLTTQAPVLVMGADRPGRDGRVGRGTNARTTVVRGDDMTVPPSFTAASLRAGAGRPVLAEFLARCLDNWQGNMDVQSFIRLIVRNRISNTYWQPVVQGLPGPGQFRYATDALQIALVSLDTALLPVDGTVVEIVNTEGASSTFEWDIANTGAAGGNIAVVPAGATAAEYADALAAAVVAEVAGMDALSEVLTADTSAVRLTALEPDTAAFLELTADSAAVGLELFDYPEGEGGASIYFGTAPGPTEEIELSSPEIDDIQMDIFAADLVSNILCRDLVYATEDVQVTRLTR